MCIRDRFVVALLARDSLILLPFSLLFDILLCLLGVTFLPSSYDWLNKMHSICNCLVWWCQILPFRVATGTVPQFCKSSAWPYNILDNYSQGFLLSWHWVLLAKKGIIIITFFPVLYMDINYIHVTIKNTSITFQQLYCFLVCGSYPGSLTKSCKMTDDFHCQFLPLSFIFRLL